MRLRLAVLLLMLTMATAAPALASDAAPTPAAIAEVASELGDALASVDGTLITRATFDREFARRSAYSQAADADALALAVLNRLIEEEVIRRLRQRARDRSPGRSPRG